MDRKKFKFWQKAIAVFLTVIFLFQPLVRVGVLAESDSVLAESEPTPEPTQTLQTTPEPTTELQNGQIEAQPTPSEESTVPNNVTATPTSDLAVAEDIQTTEVINNNKAEVNNDVAATANTGKNQVNSSQPTPSPELTSSPTPSETVPTQTETTPTSNPDQGTFCQEPLSTLGVSNPPTPEESNIEASPSPTPTPEVPPTPGPVAENIQTPDNSQNEALGKSESQGYVANENEALVENAITATSSSGQNQSSGEGTQTIETGDSIVSADLANTVNFNVVGQDFWAEVFNLLGVNNGDLDFSNVDLEQKFQEAVLTVLARNLGTGDSSTNIATADFLSSLAVFNNNIATVSNVLDLSAISGQNLAVGENGEIYTGSASVYANLFNLINTNLVGSNFWFGVFNIFGEQNGDIILPYELQFLYGENEGDWENVEAINQEIGENSQNQAISSRDNVITVKNTNEAEVKNSVDILADSGTNTAEVDSSASINTGNANAKVDIRNFVNTNIFGNRFVFLLINIFGKWQGALLGWWGDLFGDEKTVIATGQWPVPTPTQEKLVLAENQETGVNSSNSANAFSTNSLEVTNNNEAYLTNEIKGQAISGQNEVCGDSAKIETGNSSVVANIANFVNTNIIGHNFFFGIINIFGNFFGNILFPRPDLEITKSVDRQTASPGEILNYTISYKNNGRLWAKDVEIVDNLPTGLTFISASKGGVFENGKIIWKLGKILPGEEGQLTVQTKVNDNISEGDLLINQVVVSTSTDEPNKNNNEAGVSSIINRTLLSPTPTEAPGVGGLPAEGGGVGGSTAGTSQNSGGCIPPEAPAAPILQSAMAISSTEVKLTWTPVEKASYYLLAYGLESRKYIYGSPNVGNVTSYVVGSLTPGLTYYFVVAAVADGNCPAAGPYSNELSSTPGIGGGILKVGEVLAAPKEGEIGEGISVEAPGEVAGVSTPVCPFWWIALLGEAVILAGFYGLILKKARSFRFWWLAAPTLVALAFFGDKLAHHWWIPHYYCQYILPGGLVIGGIESALFKFLKKGEK